MKILFGGDYYPSKEKIDHLNKNIVDDTLAKFIKDHTYFFVNLEAPIFAKSKKYKKLLKLASNLKLDEDNLSFLKKLNVSHACLANNHIMDYKDTVAGSLVDMPDYTVTNLAVSYDMLNNLTGYLRIQDLMDTDYETVKDFNTGGRQIFAGIRATF